MVRRLKRTREGAPVDRCGIAGRVWQVSARRIFLASRTSSPGRRRCWYPLAVQSVYEAAGGDEGMLRLARAWHALVMADEVVGHAFSHGFQPDHTERLAAYWAEALGGPAVYSSAYGDETAVVRIHSGNGVHEEMDRRAVECFDQALEQVGLTAEPLRRVLHDYFAWATTTTMAGYPRSPDDVPAGLSIPRWSWEGLESAGD
jgi:hemoglobin